MIAKTIYPFSRRPDASPPEITSDKERLSIRSDALEAFLWKTGENHIEQVALPPVKSPWPEGPAMIVDLVESVATGGRTACDLDQAKNATEIGFAIHHSSIEVGARIALSDVDRSLQVRSFPWGNEKPAWLIGILIPGGLGSVPGERGFITSESSSGLYGFLLLRSKAAHGLQR